MPIIRCQMAVRAPADRCFDLARSVDLHVDSSVEIGGRAVGGRRGGLAGQGDETVWSARFWGVRFRMRTRIEGFDRPSWFGDRMMRGLLRRFDHVYRFEPLGDGSCLMSDELRVEAPLPGVGRVVERLYLVRRMDHLLRQRLAFIKDVAEGDRWRRYLVDAKG